MYTIRLTVTFSKTQSSKDPTSLLPRFSEKRHSSFEFRALKQHSKMSSQVGLAALILAGEIS